MNKFEWLMNASGFLAIGMLLAVSFLGMTGAMDEPHPLQMACIHCGPSK